MARLRFGLLSLAIPLLAGCGSIASIGTSVGAMPVHKRTEYKSPPQVIYRIDQKRYVTLENYKDCHVGGIMKWHDERKHLHVEMSRYRGAGNGFWPGKFSIEPGEERLAVAAFGCGDKECNAWIVFSNDGGKTWDEFPSGGYSSYAYRETESSRSKVINTDIRVTANGLIYVIPAHRKFMYRYRLDGTKNQRPKSTGLTDEINWYEDTYGRKRPAGAGDGQVENLYDPDKVDSAPNIKTPSGQDHFSCDPSLNPVIQEEKGE